MSAVVAGLAAAGVAGLLYILSLAFVARSRPSPSLIPEKRVRADAGAAAWQPRSEEGGGLDDFDWHGGAITRATPVTSSAAARGKGDVR